MTQFVISSGHGLKVRGASGYVDEVDEARKIVEKVAEYLRLIPGCGVKVFHDNTSTTQQQNLNTIVNYHNQQARDYDLSVHLNAYQTTSKPMGVEVLYLTQSSLAAKSSNAIAVAGGLIDRGGKKRTDLAFLNGTEMPALLYEVIFCDSKADVDLYHAHFGGICQAIAETVTGQKVPELPPPDRPEPPEIGPPDLPSGLNHIEMTIAGIGDCLVTINGYDFRVGSGDPANHLEMGLETEGDIAVTINGQDFHRYPETHPPVATVAKNHQNIEATVFGGSDDPNNSAYPPYELLDGDDQDFVALPCTFDSGLFPDNPPRVRVYKGELSAVGYVADKGPWTVDDEKYVHGEARPVAEQCYEAHKPLPSGPNKGKIPTNKAAIDLSPHLAEKIGLAGKGIVSWAFEDDATS